MGKNIKQNQRNYVDYPDPFNPDPINGKELVRLTNIIEDEIANGGGKPVDDPGLIRQFQDFFDDDNKKKVPYRDNKDRENGDGDKPKGEPENPETVLTKDEFDFINSMAARKLSKPELSDRIDACIEETVRGGRITVRISENMSGVSEVFGNTRMSHRPTLTADLLSLFANPHGLKFLTHDFDPESGLNMNDVIRQANSVLAYPKFRYIKISLRKLLEGFINGPEWIDYLNEPHKTFLLSGKMKAWTNKYPTLHPISSDEFGSEIQMFRNTVRVSKPNLPGILDAVIESEKNKNILKALDIKTVKLDKADFYTNVLVLARYIIRPVLMDIAQRESSAKVTISFERDVWNQYRLCSVRITHIGSEANPFNEVRGKIMKEGGAMFGLMKSCESYCDWTVEANFEGEYKRWRILNFRNLLEVEDLQPESVEGFTHIFTFYKK